MANTIRYNCRLCGKTINLPINDKLRKEIIAKATYHPYPIVHIHGEDSPAGKHVAVLHLDEDLNNRGTEVTQFIL